MPVESLHPDYVAFQGQRQKVQDVFNGTDTLRARGEQYLPRNPHEDYRDYNTRLDRSFLTNYVRQTVKTFASRPFTEKIRIEGDDQFEDRMTDIDGEGTSLHNLAFDAFEAQIRDGLVFLMADKPNVPGAVTEADMKGVKPYLTFFTADQVIGWKTDRVNSQERVTQVRIFQKILRDSSDDPFEVESVDMIRVLNLTTWEEWEFDKSSRKYELVKNGDYDFKIDGVPRIPIVVAYCDKRGTYIADSPMEQIADLNLAHWQSTSDLRNILHIAQVPILFSKNLGDDDGEMTIGPNSRASTSNPEGDLNWVEIEGTSIKAGQDNIDRITADMRMLSWELLVRPNKDRETATGRQIDHQESQTAIAAYAMNFVNALNRILGYLANWNRKEFKGSVVLNNDFEIATDLGALTVLMEGFKADAIPPLMFLTELQRYDVISDFWDVKKISKEVEELKKAEREAFGGARAAENIAGVKSEPTSGNESTE